MKPFIRRVVVAALAAGSAILASPGCADTEAMIFVRQAQKGVSTGGAVCNVDNSPSGLSIREGVLDVAFSLQYTATLLVGNQLVPRGNSSQLRVETSRIAIQGAVVRLQDALGTVVWGPRTVPGSGFIEPASGANANYGTTDTILVGSEYGQVLYDAMSPDDQRGLVRHFTAVVKVFGRTLGGLNVESGEWQFPLSVCYRCLVTFPLDADDTKLATQPNCALGASTGTSVPAPCAVGQDDTVDCRVCKQFFPGRPDLCDP